MIETHDTTRDTSSEYVAKEHHPITSINQDLSGLLDRGGPETRIDTIGDQSACILPTTGSLTGQPELGRGCHTKTPSSRLRDYVTNTVQLLSPSPRLPLSSASSGQGATDLSCSSQGSSVARSYET
ncbi:hypothetical protein L6164_037350 [Bauhinia variegata]|uniref:Uncharacterized protein n=1 Tax=Bauhinia variegata TaxID=167791 RepID=A0ACB9KJV1_BAUVA|nr:hypothetical protein L6164_037350 [Bauhinia variegata]